MLLLVLTALVMFTGQVLALQEQYLNNIGVDFNLAPGTESELNYVPLHPIADFYGMSFTIDSKNKEVRLRWNKTDVLFKIESRVAEVNGKRQIMDLPALNVNGNILVPLTFMESLIKVDFRWRKTPTVIIIDEKPADNLKVTLYTNKDNYDFGEPVVATLIIKNNGTSKFSTQLSSSQIYDLALSFKGREIWRWSKDKMFTSAIVNFELAPGESKVYTITLPRELILTPTQYQLQATFTCKPEIKSDIYTFTIR